MALLIFTLILGSLVGCTASGPRNETTPSSGDDPSINGPFVVSDEPSAIASAAWLSGFDAPEDAGRRILNGDTEAILLLDSTPSRLHVAVPGGGCPPHVLLFASGDLPELRLELVLTESVPEEGIQCSDVLAAHVFEVELTAPASLDTIVLAVRS